MARPKRLWAKVHLWLADFLLYNGGKAVASEQLDLLEVEEKTSPPVFWGVGDEKFMNHLQRTLRTTARLSGIGLHSGKMVNLEIRPTRADTGILFHRVDTPDQPYIKACPSNVTDTSLSTRIGLGDSSVSTIEHLMSAFFGLGVDNAVVDIDAPEVPILDGSAQPFLVVLEEAGVIDLDTPKRLLVIKKTIEVIDPKDPERFMRIEPSAQPLVSYIIDFGSKNAIGRQSFSMELSGASFVRETSFARTFCLAEQVDAMRARGLALGGSLENSVVVNSQGGLQNRHGLRSEREFVRHKILDCIGDLALLGAPLMGHVIASKAGHEMHVNLARAIESQLATACETVVMPTAGLERLWALLDFPRSLADVTLPLPAGLVRG